MKTLEKTKITVETTINLPVEKVWKYWTDPKHIVHWNHASDDWHSPRAENDLRVGGRFFARMEAKDGSSGFDFGGEYRKIVPFRQIEYVMDDGREVRINFIQDGTDTIVIEKFEAENEFSPEIQQEGWQSILDNFKKYAESAGRLEALHFEIFINASPEAVYRTMLDPQGYSVWTSEFNAFSKFVGSWDKGYKIQFVGEDENGVVHGMTGIIRENIKDKFVSIFYTGVIKEGKEITEGPETGEWAGASENYTFTTQDEGTLLSIDVDTLGVYKEYFLTAWPKALKKLKSICE